MYTTFPGQRQSGNPPLKKRPLTTMIKQELLDIIACPKCKGPVHENKEKNGLACDTCKLVYEIRDDIPIMLIDEAKPLNQDN
jgi:uncharacterized protein YbaR (Trm112 family)